MKCLKKLINFFLFFLIFILLITSCNYSSKQGKRDQDIWIGSYTDLVYKLPNPKIYTSDSIYNFSKNIKINKINDSNRLLVLNDTISKTLINTGSDTINMFFLRARKTNFNISLEDLFNSNWETSEQEKNESLKKRKLYSFRKNNKLFIQTNYIFNNNEIYSETEEYKFKLIHINQTYIIQVFNDSRYSYFGQIISKNKDSFTVEFLNKISPVVLNFKSYPKTKITYNALYKVCKDYQITQYFNKYDNGTTFKGGLRNIKQIFKNKFNYITNRSNQNGYIRVRFVVNCDGDIGRFSILETDKNYLSYSFDPKIVTTLFSIITTELKEGWRPGVYSESDLETIDNYKHITFKIEEGKIIDIFP
ncbi:hypothetical protein OBK30_12815 [Empedobacter falsenii]